VAFGILAAVDDVSLGVDPEFHLHSADSTNFRNVPNFTESLAMTFRRGLHLQFLEAVLATVVTCMASRNSFRALVGNVTQWITSDPLE
jgi:hypothetical protein